jgi:hypothetical protein
VNPQLRFEVGDLLYGVRNAFHCVRDDFFPLKTLVKEIRSVVKRNKTLVKEVGGIVNEMGGVVNKIEDVVNEIGGVVNKIEGVVNEIGGVANGVGGLVNEMGGVLCHELHELTRINSPLYCPKRYYFEKKKRNKEDNGANKEDKCPSERDKGLNKGTKKEALPHKEIMPPPGRVLLVIPSSLFGW